MHTYVIQNMYLDTNFLTNVKRLIDSTLFIFPQMYVNTNQGVSEKFEGFIRNLCGDSELIKLYPYSTFG